MDTTYITQLIGSVGFPIFMSIYLIRFMETEQREMRQTIEALRVSIDKLIDRLGREEKAGHED